MFAGPASVRYLSEGLLSVVWEWKQFLQAVKNVKIFKKIELLIWHIIKREH